MVVVCSLALHLQRKAISMDAFARLLKMNLLEHILTSVSTYCALISAPYMFYQGVYEGCSIGFVLQQYGAEFSV
jgi:hypothetical protein